MVHIERESVLSSQYLIERELVSRKGSAYAIMNTEALPVTGTRVWLLCRACGFCFPASRIAIDEWQGDQCPECNGGKTPVAARPGVHTRDLLQS